MTIDRLRNVLGAVGPPPDARELSEMLWLACHISPAAVEEIPPAPPVPPPQPPEEPMDGPGLAPPPTRAPGPPPAPLLHPHPAPAAEPVGEASEVLVPTAPMLADPLGVQRALRPLKRRVPSGHRDELDEDATAARIADTRLWTPVLVPSPVRWLTLSLVVDTGPTMRLWRPLARELAEVLLRQGAFQDVHVSYLDAGGRVASTPEAVSRHPGTLLDASGRHAVLVLSDCSGPHWWDGHAAQAVRRWAQNGPTAILQPLAERLWRRTAAPATPGFAVLPRPGAPNADLRFTPYDGAAAPGVPVPVLEVTPRWFGAWARLVSGSGPQPTAITTLPSRPSGTAPLQRERELPIAERVRRFLATASADAAELAAHVAVSVPSLPVMRLIQHRILGGSGPGQLAEVLLSGLLRPADGVRYEFVDGAREALLDTLPRPEALHTRHVLEAVSAEIERRAGTSAETFRALVPTEGGPVTLTADTDHFALLTSETRSHLAPPTPTAPDLLDLLGTSVDELIGEDWYRAPRPTAIGVDEHGSTVWVDPLRGSVGRHHGLIRGPRAARDSLVRTIVFGLALNHSPDILTFAFADFSGGASFVGLGSLPHVAAAVHTTSADSPEIGHLLSVLEAERLRRANVLRAAGVDTWDEYQAAIAEGRPLDPLPALVVIIDNAGPLLEARQDMLGPLAGLCEAGPAQGMRFVLCSPDRSIPVPLADLTGWRIEFPGAVGAPSLLTERGIQNFRPAHIALDVTDPLVERMRQRGPRARKLRWRPTQPEERPRSAATKAGPAAIPALDVLELNGGGRNGTFEETWALPASTPRDPAIGYDPEGNVVTLYPLDVSAGIPHGLIVGDTEARQHVVRNITLALAASYSPSDLTFAFAGLGEHPLGDQPLGEPLDLLHVRYSDDELLGHPGRIRRFIDYLSNELDARAAAPSSDPPGLLVFADVSLTFPSSRPEVAEALLSLAQRGRALGVQLLIASETVGRTTTWDRFLPLLGWRIVASRRTPAELQRILGRASLPFPDEHTAYLLAGGGTPRRFTHAPTPPEPVLNDFVERVTTRSRTDAGVATPDELPARLGRLLAMYDRLLTQLGSGREAVDAFRELMEEEAESRRAGTPRGPRHLVFEGPQPTRAMSACAQLYGELLTELGELSTGDPIEASLGSLIGPDVVEATSAVKRQFSLARGHVLFWQITGESLTPEGRPAAGTVLNEAMEEFGNAPVVILYGEGPVLDRLWARNPELRDRFRRAIVFSAETAEAERSAPPAAPLPEPASDKRLRIGFDSRTREPVFLDFKTDRHLLISGPSGIRKAALVRSLTEEIARRRPASERRIYILDQQRHALPSHLDSTEMSRVRYVDNADDFAPLVADVATTARRWSASGLEIYLIVADRSRLLTVDPLTPLLPLLTSGRDHGVHLVLSRRQFGFGEPPDPLVRALHGAGAPALLMGYSGQEAELWDVPEPLLGSLARGEAVWARGDRQRLVQIRAS